MPKKEFIREHKKLVQVLRSPSHKDDIKEAKEQEKELKEQTKKAASDNVSCGTGLSGKICRHNRAKLNKSKQEFIKDFKKSIDWKDVHVTVDSTDQKLAETTTSPELLQYLKTSVNSELNKIPFAKGALTVSKTAEGLYSGFFSDINGQIVDKYEPTTLDIIAKNLMVKGYYSAAVAVNPIAPHHDVVEEAEDRAIAREEATKVFQELMVPASEKSIRIKYGSFELEIKKSLNAFVKSFRDQTRDAIDQKDQIRKAINSWRRNCAPAHRNDVDAARELLNNWESHKDSFDQILFALEQLKKRKHE